MSKKHPCRERQFRLSPSFLGDRRLFHRLAATLAAPPFQALPSSLFRKLCASAPLSRPATLVFAKNYCFSLTMARKSMDASNLDHFMPLVYHRIETNLVGDVFVPYLIKRF